MGTSRVLLTIALVGACGDDGTAAMPDAATMIDAPEMQSCAAGTFPWTITFRQDEKTGPTLAGVHACLLRQGAADECKDTSITGVATFCVPEQSEIAFSAQKLGLMSILIPYVTDVVQPNDTRARILTMNVPNCTIWSSGGVSCPPSASDAGGMLHVGARQNMPGVDADVNYPVGYPEPMADVQVVLTPAALIGPFYVVNGMVDPTLTATHAAAGNALAGDVSEGDEQLVKITRTTGGNCHAFTYNAWPGNTADEIRVPIRKGFRTFAAVTCEP